MSFHLPGQFLDLLAQTVGFPRFPGKLLDEVIRKILRKLTIRPILEIHIPIRNCSPLPRRTQ